jgi:hypothetical protein
MKLGSRLMGHRLSLDLIEAGGAAPAAALDSLIHLLVRKRRLSPFIGFPERAAGRALAPSWPVEWDALSDITSRHFQHLGVCDKAVHPDLSTRDAVLAAAVCRHFRGVIKKATRDASLFQQTWSVRTEDSGRLVCEGELRSPIQLRQETGVASATRARVEVILPTGAGLIPASSGDQLQAWIFGKILGWSIEHGTLALQIKPIAILRDYVHAD